MNLVGETVTVISSTDPTKTGRRGKVVLETAKTLLLEDGGRVVRIEKQGSEFEVFGSRKVVTGSDISGRLEDRWGRAR
jgi:RNase P/RNase MRP subunit p29